MADAAALTTVTEPMADAIVRRFGVAAADGRDELPTAMAGGRAVADVWTACARPSRRPAATSDAPIVLYQGAFREDQGIEELLPALAGPDLRDVPLVAAFMGFGRLEARLREAAAATPGRIVVLPPVPSDELLEWTAGADLSFVGAPPKTINLGLTVPNKLFESLMAGTPVVVAGGTEVARLVAAVGAGVVVEPWSTPTARPGTGSTLTAAPARIVPPFEPGPARQRSIATTGRRSRSGSWRRTGGSPDAVPCRDRRDGPGSAPCRAAAEQRRTPPIRGPGSWPTA